MATTLQIVDPNNTSTVYFDLNDATGTNNAVYGSSVLTYLLGEGFDLGAPTWEANRFRSDVTAGATTVSQHPGLATMHVPIRITGTTYAAQNSAANFLAGLLADGCTIKFVADGSGVTRFIDCEPTNTPVLLDGRLYAFQQVVRLFDAPQGITLELVRQPYLSDAELDPAVNLLLNPLMIADSNNDGTPNSWTLALAAAAIDADNECVTITYNGTGNLLLQDVNASVGTVVCGSWEARLVSGDRTARMQLQSRPTTGTTLATVNITAAAWTRLSGTGTVQATDTQVRILLNYTGGTNSTVVQLRRAQLETGTATPSTFRVGTQTVSNDPMSSTNQGRYALFYNAGDAPAPVITTMTADSSSNITDLALNLRSAGRIVGAYPVANYINLSHAVQAETGSAGTNTSAVTDTSLSLTGTASGSGSNVMKTTYGSSGAGDGMNRRTRSAITAGVTGLRGDHDVWVRVRTAAASQHEIVLRWAPADINPATNSNDPYILVTSNATSMQWSDIYLGRVSMPPAATLVGMSLELWSERTDGTGDLYWDVISLVPADESVSYVEIPADTYSRTIQKSGLQTPVTAATSPADTVTMASSTYNSVQQYWVLDKLGESVGSFPASGLSVTTGRHTVKFYGSVGPAFVGVLTMRVVNITDGTIAASRLGNMTNADWPITLKFDAVAGKLYAYQVFVRSIIDGGISISKITDAVVPALAVSERIEADADRLMLSKLDTSGQLVAPLVLRGQMPFVAPPGLSVVAVRIGELESDGHAWPSSSISRVPTINFTYSPRRYV